MLWCQKQLAVDDGIVLVDDDIWKEIIKLYPSLVKCVHSNSEAVLTELQKVLLAYNDMLSIPKSSSLANGSWAYRLLLSPNFYIWLVNLAIFHYILVIGMLMSMFMYNALTVISGQYKTQSSLSSPTVDSFCCMRRIVFVNNMKGQWNPYIMTCNKSITSISKKGKGGDFEKMR